MATFWVCPIDGMLPATNGSDVTKTNNVVPSESDAVVTASTAISSTSGVTVIVTTGANFAVGDVIWIPTRKEKMQVVGKATNTLTVTRGFAGTQASGAIAIADVILSGFDANGNPPHCPLCGSAVNVMDPAFVTTQTGVASGSQHPVDANAAYGAAVAGPVAAGTEGVGTSYTTGTKFTAQPVLQHGFAALKRGDQTVTASTLNSTVGP